MNSILTVITPADSYDLTDLASVKLEFGITSTGEDTKLSAWISQASSIVAGECGRVLVLETVSEQFRIRGHSDRVILSRRPVGDITSVTEAGSVLAADDYEVDPQSGVLQRLSGDAPSCWACGKLIVVYDAGYDVFPDSPPGASPLPPALERATILMIAQYRSSATRDPRVKAESVDVPGIMSERVEFWVGATGANGSSIPPEVNDLLAPYRDFALA